MSEQRVRTLLNGFLQLVYPNCCWVCSALTATESVCATCAHELTHDPFSSCPRCAGTVGPHLDVSDGCSNCRGRPLPFTGAIRLGPYTGRLREAVLRMKRADAEEFAGVMASLWGAVAAPRLRQLPIDVVVPVPLHWTRRWRRGFNQSEILAHGLAKALAVPCRPQWLRRIRRTPFQSHLDQPAERRRNVAKAFRASAAAGLRGQTVLLVDDVLTTGATASEAALALRAAGPARIFVAVLAHAL